MKVLLAHIVCLRLSSVSDSTELTQNPDSIKLLCTMGRLLRVTLESSREHKLHGSRQLKQKGPLKAMTNLHNTASFKTWLQKPGSPATRNCHMLSRS